MKMQRIFSSDELVELRELGKIAIREIPLSERETGANTDAVNEIGSKNRSIFAANALNIIEPAIKAIKKESKNSLYVSCDYLGGIESVTLPAIAREAIYISEWAGKSYTVPGIVIEDAKKRYFAIESILRDLEEKIGNE